jgi:hypothetical protein
MLRLIMWTAFSGFFGFCVFGVLFFFTVPRGGPDRLLFMVFALMGGVSTAAIGAVFGAVLTIVREFDEIRREIHRLHRFVEGSSSTQFKPGLPSGGLS